MSKFPESRGIRQTHGFAGRLVEIAILSIFTLSALAIAAIAQETERSTHGAAGTIASAFLGSSEPLIDVNNQRDWISGLSVSGYFLNTTGLWLNSSGLTNFGRQSGERHGSNSLSVERELLQVDANYRLNRQNHFFFRFWGVYEPPYPWEADNIAGPDGVFNKSQSEIYNRYDLREAYWKFLSGPLTIFTGKQIITWGESLAFRVGDVVNPQDLSWNFGFANLEQSRLPLWMIHPIISLPATGNFQSTFLEGIWAPAWQPLYTGVDYVDRRYLGQDSVAGSVDLLPPAGGRFDTYPYPFTIPAFTPRGFQPAFPQVLDNGVTPSLSFRLPSDQFSNSVGGVRLHTVFEDAEMTFFCWHGHQFGPTSFVTGAPMSRGKNVFGQNFQLRYPDLNDAGATINRPVYLSGTRMAEVPFVLRAEAVWQDRTPFNTLNVSYPSSVTTSSTFNSLIALDIDELATPWLSSTGALTTNLEWNNYTILSPSGDFVYGGYAERWRHSEEQLLFSAQTSWWWGSIVPEASAIYNPDGNTFLLFPSISLTPPWTNRYSMTFQYIGVISNDRYGAYAGGNFKGKSLLLAQFQYNFDLIRGRSD